MSTFFFFLFVVDFVIHWNETAKGLHVVPIPIPPPTSHLLNIPVALVASDLPSETASQRDLSPHFCLPFACHLVLTSLGVGTGGILVILAQPLLGKPCILRPGEWDFLRPSVSLWQTKFLPVSLVSWCFLRRWVFWPSSSVHACVLSHFSCVQLSVTL